MILYRQMDSLFELKCVSDKKLPHVFYIIETKTDRHYARLSQRNGEWVVWYYTEKYKILRNSLSSAFLSIERQYLKNKNEIPTEPSREGY